MVFTHSHLHTSTSWQFLSICLINKVTFLVYLMLYQRYVLLSVYAHRSSFHTTIMHTCFNSDETLNEIPDLLPFPQLHERGSDEKTLHCIEKQALVQVIIRELAKHLLPENYKATACVSANLSDVQTLQQYT